MLQINKYYTHYVKSLLNIEKYRIKIRIQGSSDSELYVTLTGAKRSIRLHARIAF